MSHNSSSTPATWHRFLASIALIAMLLTSVPMTVLAQDAGDTGEPGTETNAGDTGDETTSGDVGENTGDGSDGTDGDADGDGETGDAGTDDTEDGEDGDTVEVETENIVGPEGAPGDAGETRTDAEEGDEGADGTAGEVTGGQEEQGTGDATIETGDATATGELSTDANNNNVTSDIVSSTPGDDFDDYTFNATGTNEAIVGNAATTTAVSGENSASSTDGDAHVGTGDATAVLNIANIVNTNVVNSNGLIKLLNVLLEAGQSFDLREIFSWDPDTLAAACTLMSCAAEDVVYNVSQENLAELTNEADLDAISGANSAVGETATVTTGDAYASANVLNVANTNIIDSNYLLLALNLLGSLDGHLILPTADLFTAFFAQPNGMTRTEQQGEEASINNENTNNATTTNNVLTNAETGLNQATTTTDAIITTGESGAESNIVNEINKNLFGGDSMYMLIRVHGAWNGNVYGLPDGITWARTDDGILIYNEDSEIAPSQIIAYDIDSYTANFENQNDVTINNNLDLNALSGANSVEAATGTIATGNAYAGANVMNIANTNVIGRNWVMATMNIFGDFDGDISFGQPDLWIGGKVQAADTPVGPGTRLTFTYTITNNGDLKADDVTFTQDLDSAYTFYTEDGAEVRDTSRIESLGSVRPGETITVSYDAYVNEDIPFGVTDVHALARIDSDEPDGDDGDNEETLTIVAERPQVATGGGGGSSSGGGGGDRGRDRDNDRRESRVLGTKLSRTAEEVDPSGPPELKITKTSDQDPDEVIAAGTVVNYTITVTNDGGTAYDAKVVDTLTNPIGSVVTEQTFDLGDILPGEHIDLTYEIQYDAGTPTGEYRNTATLVAYETKGDSSSVLKVNPSSHTLTIRGRDLAVGNVSVVGTYLLRDGTAAAILSWETNKPTDGQVFFSEASGVSPYDPNAVSNYGYTHASYFLPQHTTHHFVLLAHLTPGTEYTYRIRSANGTTVAFGGDYTFTTPGTAPVAVQRTTPAPQVAAAPAPEPAVSRTVTQSTPTPEPAPEFETAPRQGDATSGRFAWAQSSPEPTPSTSSSTGSFVAKAVSTVTEFFGF